MSDSATAAKQIHESFSRRQIVDDPQRNSIFTAFIREARIWAFSSPHTLNTSNLLILP
jgi:hypothetical protein